MKNKEEQDKNPPRIGWSNAQRRKILIKMLLILEAQLDAWIDQYTEVVEKDDKKKTVFKKDINVDLKELNNLANTVTKLQEALAVEDRGWYKQTSPRARIQEEKVSEETTAPDIAALVTLSDEGDLLRLAVPPDIREMFTEEDFEDEDESENPASDSEGS